MFIKNFGPGGRKSFLLLLPLLLVLLLVLFSVTSHGSQNQEFINACGDIHNISFPFQLQGDPSNTCNDRDYTLICDENNRTLLQVFFGKYYVRSINYTDYSISLLNAIDQTTSSILCASVPRSPFTPSIVAVLAGDDAYTVPAVTWVALVSCENSVHTPNYFNTTGYCHNNTDNPGNGNYSYVVTGYQLKVRDIADSCSVDALYLSSSQLIREMGSNMSLSDMSRELWYAIQASWESVRACERCRKRASCFGDSVNVISLCGDSCKFVPFFRISNLWTQTHRGWWTQIKYNRFFLLLTIGVVLSARLLCAPCVYGFLMYKFSRRHLSTFDSIEGFLRSQNKLVLIRYSYSDIKKMTNGFRDKLGQGGYGSVYKGKLRSGIFVAVKMLSKPEANGQDFINEVATIGRIHHVNVVELIGYCVERSKRALVYDFMPNGSLEKHICSPEGKLSLSCKKMYEISLGVARGVGYLHQGCDMQILHFDIKPHNILLDEDFTPKVSDFGLAKLYPTNDGIMTVTTARGTLGYMAPELFYKNIGGVSYKFDIYSFGMLLMEMAGRRRNWNSSANSSQIFFPSWVYDQFAEGKNIQIGETTEEESEMVKKMMLVALWCIQMKPCDRPSMNKVIEMLEGSIELLPMPPKPFLFSQGRQPVNNGINKRWSNLSGACMDSLTYAISGR